MEGLPVTVKDPDIDLSIEKKPTPEDHTAQTSPKTPTPTLETFHIFSNLPQEIQDQIWSCALEQEGEIRIVILEDETRRVRPTAQLASPYLATSRGSRAIALKRYPKRLFVWHSLGSIPRKMGSVYLNLERDTYILGLKPLLLSEHIFLTDKFDGAEYAEEIEQQLNCFGIVFHTWQLTKEECARITNIWECHWDYLDFVPHCCWARPFNGIENGCGDPKPKFNRMLFSKVSESECHLLMLSNSAGNDKLAVDLSMLDGEKFWGAWKGRLIPYDFRSEEHLHGSVLGGEENED